MPSPTQPSPTARERIVNKIADAAARREGLTATERAAYVTAVMASPVSPPEHVRYLRRQGVHDTHALGMAAARPQAVSQ